MRITMSQLRRLIEEELISEKWLDNFYISKKRAAELDQERELDLPPARKFAKDSVQTNWYGDYGSGKEAGTDEIEDTIEWPSTAEKEKTSKIKDSHPFNHWVSFVEEVNDMYKGPQGGALDGKIKKKKNITKFKSAEDKERARGQKEIIKRLDILKRNLRPGAWSAGGSFRDEAIRGAKQRLVNDILRNLQFLSGSYGENTSPNVVKKDVDDLTSALENDKISLKIINDRNAMITEGNIKMKITKQKLINLIKEEIARINESDAVLPDDHKAIAIIRDLSHMQAAAAASGVEEAAKAWTESVLLALHNANMDILSDEMHWPARNYIENVLASEIDGDLGEAIKKEASMGWAWDNADEIIAPGKIRYAEPGPSKDY